MFGEIHGIDGVALDRVTVQPTAVQFPDGSIDTSTVHEPPHVYLGDDGLANDQPAEQDLHDLCLLV